MSGWRRESRCADEQNLRLSTRSLSSPSRPRSRQVSTTRTSSERGYDTMSDGGRDCQDVDASRSTADRDGRLLLDSD